MSVAAHTLLHNAAYEHGLQILICSLHLQILSARAARKF